MTSWPGRGAAVLRLRAAVRAGPRGVLRPGRRNQVVGAAGPGRVRASSLRAAIDGDAPLLFTGEMVYPWVFEHDPALRPLAEAAELLAQRE